MQNTIPSETLSITSRSLIAASRVRGTSVYNLIDEELGTVEDIMIDKVTGRAIYAVMSFGGFLGIGESLHPIPWATLKYSEEKGGYVIDLDKNKLTGAPSHTYDPNYEWTPEYGRRVDRYYDVPSYWM